MAHLIEQMAYVGATPWHGLGICLMLRFPPLLFAVVLGCVLLIIALKKPRSRNTQTTT